MGAVGGILSAFMNNVAALVLPMPVDVAAARKSGRAPGLSLMQFSFATILGGMVTLIGTPPNIIIATIRDDALGAPFGMFDFAPVGGITALAGLAFVALVGWRLIPRREGASGARETAAYIAELTIAEGSRQIGRTLGDLYDEAEAEALGAFRTSLKLDFADHRRKTYLEAEKAGLVMVKVVVPATARIRGKTAEAVGLVWRQRTLVMGISRRGHRITGPLRKAAARTGDILLLLAPYETGGSNGR